MTQKFNREFTIDEITVIPSHNKIVIDGSEQKIEPKIMQVLCFLAANQGRVVSRQEIATQLWPDTVVGVEVITRAIFELRKALNDSASAPRYIETVARQGYCFIHEVKTDVEPEVASVSLAVSNHKTGVLRKWFVVSSGVATLLCVMLIAVFSSTDSDESRAMPFVATVLTDDSVHAAMPTLNEDATDLLFVRDHQGQSDKRELVLLELNSHQERVLNVVDGDIVSPVWIPGRNALLYLACGEDNCTLMKQELTAELSDSPSSELYLFERKAYSLSLSHDGSELIVSHQQGADFVLSRYNLQEGTISSLVTETRQSSRPVYARQANQIYYLSYDRGSLKGLYKHNLKDGSNLQLTDQFYSIFSIAAKSDNQVWIAGKREGTSGIWSLDLSTGKLQERLVDVAGSFYADLYAPAGKSALVLKKWSRDIDVYTHSPELPDFKGLSSSAIDYYGRYTTSTNTMLFVSNRSGTYEIWRSDEIGATKLTNLRASSLSEPLLSEEHNTLAVIERDASQNMLRLFELSAQADINTLSAISETVIPKSTTLLNWLSYDTLLVSLFENNQYVLASLHAHTGNIERLALDAGLFAKAQDGNLWYVDLKNEQIVVRDNSGTVTPLFDVSALNIIRRPFHMNIDGEELVYAAREHDGISIKRVTSSDLEPVTVFTLPGDAVITQLGINESPLVIYDRRLGDRSAILMLDFDA